MKRPVSSLESVKKKTKTKQKQENITIVNVGAEFWNRKRHLN